MLWIVGLVLIAIVALSVLGRAQHRGSDLPGVVRPPRGQQPLGPQQAADMVSPELLCHRRLLLGA